MSTDLRGLGADATVSTMTKRSVLSVFPFLALVLLVLSLSTPAEAARKPTLLDVHLFVHQRVALELKNPTR